MRHCFYVWGSRWSLSALVVSFIGLRFESFPAHARRVLVA